MGNPIPAGEVKASLERTKRDFAELKAKLDTYEGQMEILYEGLADGDITEDQFNTFSIRLLSKWNK